MNKAELEKQVINDLTDKINNFVEKQIEDMLTNGQGFSKTTNYPPKILHIPYSIL